MEKATSAGKGLIRIAITGPESTGKSWLARELAAHFHTVYVPEAARDYLNSLGRAYEQEDLLKIARQQIQAENLWASHANKFLFCDTELLVIKIWSEVKYQNCHPAILQQLQLQYYPLYLLCDIDLPWEDDPLREHPHARDMLMKKYREELKKYNRNYVLTGGLGKQRLQNAIHIIEQHFNTDSA